MAIELIQKSGSVNVTGSSGSLGLDVPPKGVSLDYINNHCANAFKGIATGTDIVEIGDISPNPHTIKVSATGANNVVTCGKNLFNIDALDGNFYNDNNQLVGKDVCWIDEDKVIHSRMGLASWRSLAKYPYMTILPAGTYRFSWSAYLEYDDASGGATTALAAVYVSSGRKIAYSLHGEYRKWKRLSFTFTLDKAEALRGFVFQRGDAGIKSAVLYKDIQLERQWTLTDYEPYVGASYPVVDGVAQVESLYPEITIIPDAVGSTITAEYIKDSNKVVEQLTQAIISLGGNI